VLDDIGPTSEWVEEYHPAKFEADFDIDGLELGGIGLGSNLLGGAVVNKAPSMAHVSTTN